MCIIEEMGKIKTTVEYEGYFYKVSDLLAIIFLSTSNANNITHIIRFTSVVQNFISNILITFSTIFFRSCTESVKMVAKDESEV